jgi:hypothetical protein
MVSHNDLCEKFANRETESLQGSRMFIDGKAIYSYGHHFPVAYILNERERVALFNTDKYSSSTSKHQNYVRSALNSSGVYIVECNTSQIKSAINNPTVPVIIERYKDYSDLEDYEEKVIELLKSKGIARPHHIVRKAFKSIKDWTLIKEL